MENNVFSVSQVNKYIKMLFDSDMFLNKITIKGEITNFKAHYTGHFYFTLKDEASTIKCVMFKSYASLVKFKPEDGMKVTITGQISVFERDGVYQIYCNKMEKDGLGDLYIAYEELKKKLEKEGLFDSKCKKEIPFLPNRVGVITSKTGAVIRDIINVSTRRYKKADILIYPAAVQGVNAASTVIKGIETFNKLNNVDVIIIARGGGSFEDLFGFNDENLARKIFESKIPIVSAVGHETDFTICDFVSDLRAPTPSAAAELVYPEYIDILNRIDNAKVRLNLAIKNYVKIKKEYVNRLKSMRLEKEPLEIISKNRLIIDSYLKNIENKIRLNIQNSRLKTIKQISKIDALSPLKTLSRGYSYTTNENNKAVNFVNDVKKGEKIHVRVVDGTFDAIVD